MILKVKHRAAYYRRFHLDIWGLLRTTLLYRPAPVSPPTELWRAAYIKQPDDSILDALFDTEIRPSSAQRVGPP
jgi:hypothetical protein